MKELSKEEMKKIMGGVMAPIGCWTTSNCDCGQKCAYSELGEMGNCVDVAQGTSCSTDYDCGNGQHCIRFSPPLSGGYCRTGVA